MQVEYRLLGPLEAVVDGREARLGGAEAARDARPPPLPAEHCRPGIATRRRALGRGPTGSAANLVQGYVSGLRKALGKEAIETRGAGYVAPRRAGRPRPPAVRAARARRERRARAGRLRRRAAASLARRSRSGAGPRSPTSPTSRCSTAVTARLEELRVLALERRVEAELALGRHADVVGELERSSPSIRSASGRAGC